MDAKKVVFDTNFLLVPYQFKIDVFLDIDQHLEPPYKILIPSSVISELKGLAKNFGRQGMAARFALKLVDTRVAAGKATIIKGSFPVDEWLVNYAKENSAIVCTNDKILRQKLINESIKMIVVKSRSKLGLV